MKPAKLARCVRRDVLSCESQETMTHPDQVRIAWFFVEMALGHLSGGSDEARDVSITHKIRAIPDQNAGAVLVFECKFPAAVTAQPKVLHGVSIRRHLADGVTFVEPKQSSLPVVERHSAVRIRAHGNHSWTF